MKKRYQNKNFILTVEGECEKYYFEHLAKLINSNPKRRFNCTFNPKIHVSKYPSKRVKQCGAKLGTFYHIQDIEDANDDVQLNKFHAMLDDLKEANKVVEYNLGYTNYCFELWIVLHKRLLNVNLQNRKKYLSYINDLYSTNFTFIDEYKNEDNFKELLKQISLNDVLFAINNGKIIRSLNETVNPNVVNQRPQFYGKFKYYKENPDLDIHLVVENIINSCL